MNNCSFTGRMGANPKFYVAQGDKKAIINFSLAIQGMKKDDVDWLDFVAFGKTAELINQYCIKGSMVCIERARANKSSYKDQSGADRHVTKFIVDSLDLGVTFASTKNNNNGNNNNSNNNSNNNNGYNNNNNNNNNNNSSNNGYNNNNDNGYYPVNISQDDIPF